MTGRDTNPPETKPPPPMGQRSQKSSNSRRRKRSGDDPNSTRESGHRSPCSQRLAVWRADPAPTASPLPASLRQQLSDFFAALERSAGEAEATFRQRVEAMLMVPPADPGEDAGVPTDTPARAAPR
jgi:hypothetical protein